MATDHVSLGEYMLQEDCFLGGASVEALTLNGMSLKQEIKLSLNSRLKV